MATTSRQSARASRLRLTEERKACASSRRVRGEGDPPKAAEYNEHDTHAADLVAKAHELGLMNLHVPESLGGLGLSTFEGSLSRGAELGLLRNRHVDRRQRARRRPVIIAGSEEQQSTWLRRCSRSRSSARSASPNPRRAPTWRS